jgi:uncharacterized ion transporter superfamily protein YfcC
VASFPGAGVVVATGTADGKLQAVSRANKDKRVNMVLVFMSILLLND